MIQNKTLEILTRIDQQIRLANTGTKKAFAKRMELSVRQLGNYIACVREELGLKIGYSHLKQTYFYENHTIFEISFGKS